MAKMRRAEMNGGIGCQEPAIGQDARQRERAA